MPAGVTFPIDAGAGANLNSPANLLKSLSIENGLPKGIPEQMQRALAVAAYFFSGVVAINTSQMLAAPMSSINSDWYDGWLSLTKQSFGVLTTTMTQFWAPTVMRVSGDASVRGQLMKDDDGDLICNFPDRLVLIANHQIYTDWLYLWWIAYTAGKHGNVYIILKESLKKIPVIGWGMQLNKFIFLKRNWEADKPHLSEHMQRLNKLAEPMWLMLFPEGTNLAPDTRIKSRKWAAKNHLKDMQHTLLPRATGLRFCLQELRSTVGYVYDCTVAYSGVPRGQYAQDIYTLRASYLEGNPPKSVNMYWRRFKVADIPLDNSLAFESWLLARWREKDALIEYFYTHGRFPADKGVSLGPQGQFLRGAGHLESEVRANKWKDFLQVFAPMGMLALVLFMFYGALPKEMIGAIGDQAGELGKLVEGGGGNGAGEKGEPKKKLLAFDGTGFKQVSAGHKEFAEKVKEGMSRPTVRRADSVSSMSTGPRGPPSTVASEPRRMLGYSGGRFREISPARSVASVRTVATRNTAPVGKSISNSKTKKLARSESGPGEKKKLLGFGEGGFREVSSGPEAAGKAKSPASKVPAKTAIKSKPTGSASNQTATGRSSGPNSKSVASAQTQSISRSATTANTNPPSALPQRERKITNPTTKKPNTPGITPKASSPKSLSGDAAQPRGKALSASNLISAHKGQITKVTATAPIPKLDQANSAVAKPRNDMQRGPNTNGSKHLDKAKSGPAAGTNGINGSQPPGRAELGGKGNLVSR